MTPDAMHEGSAAAATFAIDGRLAERTVRPRTAGDVCDLLVRACADRLAIVPAGGGTALQVGNVPARCDVMVDMRGLCALGEHSAADLVVTASAGTPLEDLNAHLAYSQQFLPLDAPAGATLGGIVAAAQAGRRRLSRGTVRDWLIGATAIAGDGRTLRAGAKVVKNVAGYDLLKLLCGSGGTLALLTELTFKVAPRPEAIAAWQLPCADLAAAERVRRGAMNLKPAWLELSSATDRSRAVRASTTPSWLSGFEVEVGFEGDADAVAWQSERLLSRFPDAAAIPDPGLPGQAAGIPGRAGGLPDQAVGLLGLDQDPVSDPPDGLRFRLATPPDRLAAVLERCLGVGAARVQAHLGSGIADLTAVAAIFGDPVAQRSARAEGLVTGGDDRAELPITRMLAAWQTEVEAAGGWWRLEQGPKEGRECFGPQRSEWAIGAQVKQLFDPCGILSPGRAPGRF